MKQEEWYPLSFDQKEQHIKLLLSKLLPLYKLKREKKQTKQDSLSRVSLEKELKLLVNFESMSNTSIQDDEL